MFKKRKIEVVPESQYTDFSDRIDESKYATKKTVIAASIPIAVVVPIVTNKMLNHTETYTTTTIPVAATAPIEPILQIPVTEPVLHTLTHTPLTIPVNMSSTEFIQTGVLADASLNAIANVMQPLINILVAVSFPVASVIMVGACFFFMFGNSEKAWSMIMNAGLGYVLIQMSPLFLNMLRTVGGAV